jgi:hypothetical protein
VEIFKIRNGIVGFWTGLFGLGHRVPNVCSNGLHEKIFIGC